MTMSPLQESFRAVYGPNEIGPDNKALQIANLAKAGVAASDSMVNIEDVASQRLYRRAGNEVETKKRTPPITLSPRLLAHLRRWEKEAGRFVVSFDGQGVSSIKTAWASVVRRAGLEDVTPHTLRHTAITWACQTGKADMWELGGYFGVSPETMHKVYAHHHPDYQQNAVAALGGRKL